MTRKDAASNVINFSTSLRQNEYITGTESLKYIIPTIEDASRKGKKSVLFHPDEMTGIEVAALRDRGFTVKLEGDRLKPSFKVSWL